jgi:hypothetical protein
MKRSSPLVGLSREHHEALVLARRAASTPLTSETARGQREHLLRRWDEQVAGHFAIEESVLLPALVAAGEAGAAAEALAQHAHLTGLDEREQGGDLSALPVWGEAKLAHVRFEERALFPLAERTLDLAALADSMSRARDQDRLDDINLVRATGLDGEAVAA